MQQIFKNYLLLPQENHGGQSSVEEAEMYQLSGEFEDFWTFLNFHQQ